MPKRKIETPLTTKTKSGAILSKEEETFCQEYVRQMGNGTEAMIKACKGKGRITGRMLTRNTAGVMASEALRKPKILERIREILDLSELNDETVDVELNFLVKQHDDLHAKKGGIDIYNKLKGRYAEDNTRTIKFAGKDSQELEERAAELISGIIGNPRGTGKEAK